MKQLIYCELEFLLNFFNSKPVFDFNLCEESREFKEWINYRDFLLDDNSIILLDIKITCLEQYKNNNEMNLFVNRKNYFNNLIFDQFIEIQKEPDAFFEKVNPHAIFFLSDITKCKQFEEDYGMLFISNDNIYEFTEKIFGFKEELIFFNPDNKSILNWDFISKYKSPCNSMVIVDNYIFEKNTDINLKPLILKLLPGKSLGKLKFHIYIITMKVKNHRTKKDLYCKILNYFGDELKKNIKLKIIYDIKTEATKHHDRNIITNYLWINSGVGFTIFERDYCHQKINVFTHFTLFAIPKNQTIRKVIESLKKLYNSLEESPDDDRKKYLEEHVIPSNQSGIITNRLLKNN